MKELAMARTKPALSRRARTTGFASVLTMLSAATALSLCASANAATPNVKFALKPVSKVALPPPGTTRCNSQAYVSVNLESAIAVVDTKTNKVTATIPVGGLPSNPTITPDGTQVYVSNTEEGTLSVIDVGSNKVVSTIKLNARSGGLAFTADGKYLVATLFGEPLGNPVAGRLSPAGQSQTTEIKPDWPGGALVITRATGKVSRPIQLGVQPERAVVTPDGRYAYVTNLRGASVAVIDIARAKLVTTIPTEDALPYNFAMHPNGKTLYVGMARANKISVIDTATNRVVKTIAVGQGVNGIAFNPDHTRLYVTNVQGNSVQYVDLATGQTSAAKPVDRAPGFIDLTPDGSRAYFVHAYLDNLSVVDTTTLAVTDTIKVGRAPTVIAVCNAP